VLMGQSASIRFSNFNQRTTPEINGHVSRMAAGQSHFAIRIAIADPEIARLDDAKLAPGMQVEVFMQTEARTALSYLIKPLHDQIVRAFRGR
jgi:HlyD family secretion protein